MSFLEVFQTKRISLFHDFSPNFLFGKVMTDDKNQAPASCFSEGNLLQQNIPSSCLA